MNQLYEFQKRQAAILVFATPYILKATVFYNFSVFGIDNSGLSEQNIIEYLFEYNFIVFLKFIIDNHTYM